MPRVQRSPPGQVLQHTSSDSDVAKLVSNASVMPYVSQRQKRPRETSEENFSDFKSEIKSILEDWKTSQNSLLNKLVSEIAEIKQQNTHIKKSNEDIEKALEFINLQYEDMNNKITILEEERKEYKLYITELETKIEDLQRNSKASVIEIRNMPIINQPETKSDLCNIVQNASKALNVIMPQTAIRDVYRLNGKYGKGTIIADLNSVILKNEIIQGVKIYNKNHPNERLTTAAIGYTEKNSPIYISESLTIKGRRLFYLARDLARSRGYKFCWTNNGRIYLRKTSESTHIEVKSELQLELLKNQQ